MKPKLPRQKVLPPWKPVTPPVVVQKARRVPLVQVLVRARKVCRTSKLHRHKLLLKARVSKVGKVHD